MYCAPCRVHFSGSTESTQCPYCGRDAGPTPASIAVEVAEAPAKVARGDPDRTRTEAPRSDAWPPGKVVAGKYEVLSLLGSGGFGTVYKVRHAFRKKIYALKTPHPEFVKDEAFRRRFEREIEAMERFIHPDVVVIRDSGLTDELQPYFTMDFVDGETLKAVLRREERLPVDRTVAIICRVLRVLDAAHAHSVVHRDIKPDNIILTRVHGREAVKILDFGVAKLLDLVGESGSITRGERVGTPRYMSPEQIRGERVDARSDLFSLGLVLYEMLTGRHPFTQSRDPVRVTAGILGQDAVPPGDLVPEVPRALSDLVLWMLAKKPKERPASSAILLEGLAGFLDPAPKGALVERLTLLSRIPREPTTALLLRQRTAEGERRCFLLFDERAAFGRSNEPGRGIRNQLILRRLPCRSREADAENWERNLTISHSVGTLYPDGSSLVVEPAPGLKHGLSISGLKIQQTARLPADRFHIAVGERALELDCHRALRASDERVLDLAFLEAGRPPGVKLPQSTGYSNRSCHIDFVRLLRAGNAPHHEYYCVYRALKLGSSAEAGLRIEQGGVEGVHAVVLHEAGEAFLLAIEAGVRIAAAPAASGAPRSSEWDLPPGRLTPLVPGIEVRVGECLFSVEAALEAHFKTV